MGSGADNMMDDPTDPSHYRKAGNPILFMMDSMSDEAFRGFLAGNVVKYVCRYQHKNGLEDLAKARVYLTWLMEHVEGGYINV